MIFITRNHAEFAISAIGNVLLSGLFTIWRAKKGGVDPDNREFTVIKGAG